MADGDKIPTDGNTQTDQGGWLKHLSIGTKNYSHEPTDFSSVPLMLRPSMQMVQVAQGSKYCPCCGDVRPHELFNEIILTVEQEAIILLVIRAELLTLGRSPTLRKLLHPFGKWLYKWCRSCQQVYAPETMGLQYCPKCQKWDDPDKFYNAESWLCIEHEKQRKNDKYALNAGGSVRAYAR